MVLEGVELPSTGYGRITAHRWWRISFALAVWIGGGGGDGGVDSYLVGRLRQEE